MDRDHINQRAEDQREPSDDWMVPALIGSALTLIPNLLILGFAARLPLLFAAGAISVPMLISFTAARYLHRRNLSNFTIVLLAFILSVIGFVI